MRGSLLLSLFLIPLLGFPICAADQDDDLPVLKTDIKTVAAFKNGLGFVFRSGETKLKDGWAMMDQIPAAALGTLWIGTTSKSGPVEEVISSKRKVQREYDAVNLAELLEANVGREVAITYAVGGTSPAGVVIGTIVAVAKDRKPDDLGPFTSDDPSRNYRLSLDATAGQVVLLKIQRGGAERILAINKSSILSVDLPTDSSSLKTKIEREAPGAKLRIGGKSKSAEITMAYLEKGINWSPSYLINIQDDKQADIVLEAVLSNDVEDLKDAEVSFVVGYPNFMFADIMTPMALQQTVATFVQGLMGDRSRNERGSGYGGVMAQSVAYNSPESRPSSWSPESTYSATQPMPGESNEDLYFYRQEHVTLKKGDRARYTVFTGKVPYEHIYQWDIPDSMNIDDRGYRLDSSRRTEDSNQVWHALRVENTTKHPWTTAPAFAVNGSMPVAQDVLKYTPAGGKNTLKLTVATDVRAEQMQTELARKVTHIANRDYDEVTVNGKLTVKNWKQKPIKVNVKKSLIGDVKEAGHDGKVSKVIKQLTAVNSNSEIEWEFDLDPGKTTELTYQYIVLLNR